MRKWQALPERSDTFVFDHKPSEINYGGGNRFHQAAFPAEGARPGFEAAVFAAVSRFTAILQAPASAAGVGPLPQPELTEIFFDQWGETPRLSAAAFGDWINGELAAVAAEYRALRRNALEQEAAAGVPRLNYLVSLAATTLISTLISEFYEKQIEQLGPLATQARLTLGRCLALALRESERDPELRRVRQEKLGAAAPDEAGQRLLNPFILAFADTADAGLVDETLAGSNFFHLSGRLRLRLLTLLGQVLVKSRKYEARNLKRSLSEPETLRLILDSPAERRRLLNICRQQSEFRQQLVSENVLGDWRRALRRAAAAAPSEDLLKVVANNRQLTELLTRSALRAKLVRHLRDRKHPQAAELKTLLRDGERRFRRSRRAWFGRLSSAELTRELEGALGRLSDYLAQTEDFRLLRTHYGRDTNRMLEWQGIKIWRATECVPAPRAAGEAGTLQLELVWDRRRAEVENAFAEGNLFLCRAAGPVFPLAGQRRIRTVFLFADLRNSTETTMKLTKDTASYLAPYLTAVDSEARAASGERIYFAGDGYAAYYAKPADAIRAAYGLSGRFHKLRLQANEELHRRAKAIIAGVRERDLDLAKPAGIRKALEAPDAAPLPTETRAFLEAVAALDPKSATEDNLKKLLLRVSAEYSMPRIEAGVAITTGDLFFAMVGEEGQPKIPIVISPALTQAARLSGSADVVKRYLEEHYTEPFPYNAFVWDEKLYNRGIVIISDLVEELKSEVELKPLATPEAPYAHERLLGYLDPKLKRRIVLREIPDPIMLKGIASACRVYEVALPFSALDRSLGAEPAL